MKLEIYSFAATEENGKYQFEGYKLPTGEILCPEESTNDTFYACLDDVQAHGAAFVESSEPTGRTIEFSEAELRESIQGSAREFGNDAIPESLRSWLDSAKSKPSQS